MVIGQKFLFQEIIGEMASNYNRFTKT